MIDEGELRTRFPEIPWDQPGHAVAWCCRYCIAMHGLKAQNLIHNRTQNAYRTSAIARAHIERAHHD